MATVSSALGIATGVTSGLALLALLIVATMFVLLARTRRREREIEAAAKAESKEALAHIAAHVDPEHNIPVEKLTAKAAAAALMERMRLRAATLRSLLSQAIWAFVICFVVAVAAKMAAGFVKPPPPPIVPAPIVSSATLNLNGDIAYTLDTSNLDVDDHTLIKVEVRSRGAAGAAPRSTVIGNAGSFRTVINGSFPGGAAGDYEFRYVVNDAGSTVDRAGPWTLFTVTPRPDPEPQ